MKKKPAAPIALNHNTLLQRDLPLWRARAVLVLLLGCSFALVARAAWLQGFNKDFLQAKGESRYARVLEVPATRGQITDRNGDILAISTPVRSIWAIPSDVNLSPADARTLAGLLEMEVGELNSRLAGARDFVYLRRQLAPEVAERVLALKLPGIHQQQEYRRYYPDGETSAHVLGFTSVEDRGQEGMELAHDEMLNGVPGSRRVIKDRRGQVVEDVESIRPPRDGETLALAIDNRIQYLAYSALRDAMTTHRARAGAVVVLDAHTGEVLALVNAPTYNPNNRANLTGAQLRNRVITDTFEPGSTLKPFAVALAMDKGQITGQTRIDTAPGRITIGRATISDTSRRGVLSVAEIVQKSSNVGTVKIAMEISPQDMWGFYDALGFGRQLGIGFPGEAAGRLRPAASWRPIEQATMSYGHGMSVTLIQLARAYLAFARDGDLLPLSLLRLDEPPQGGQRVVSAEVAREMRGMLEMAAGPGGTARRAQIEGYRVAGKTGTAHKLEGGRYVDKYVSSFVGFAPVSSPRLVVAVMIDEPSAGQHYGGAVAAPVFAQVTGSALRVLGVAPDAPLAPLRLARPEAEAGTGGAL